MPTLRARRTGSRVGALAAPVATALLTLAALAVSIGTGPAQAAPNPTGSPGSSGSAACVGLVVDNGTGTVDSTCHPFSPGLTGQELLAAAGHRLTFDKAGFICQIDGYPETCASDNTHFWGYFHRAPGAADGKWAFSQKGASDYVVHPGETEGWAYQNGGQRQPKPVPYASLQQAAASAHPVAAHRSSAAGDDDGGASWPLFAVIAVVVLLLAGASVQIARRRRG